ncbi:Trifunctional nucleotide phosphoesterase protein YfkN precursor [Roseovarius sp. THAF27]|uniref:5'-nucleotidase C-terminal domain-containing protein n=1 Tax=Roseovarius sp. THAF27 TaxID=2587850 RepID=UPI001268237E|nr:5'-nucleotidase C-terminal domain-containing protein [Roseovarius sp. THAF27]QFT81549.1 Trifunctional nucleotide phosphoesterase protein YfkN precursor [Roseovarius sp. THAF27]
MFSKYDFGTPWGHRGHSWKDKFPGFWDWCNPRDDDAPTSPPTASDDVARVVGRKAKLDLLANDLPGEDGDADDLFISEINGKTVGNRKFFLLKDEESGVAEGFLKIKADGTVKVKAFPWFDGELDFTYRVSDGETESDEAQVTVEMLGRKETFTLNLLHFADQEAGAAAVADAPNFSGVLNALRDEDVGADATLTLSSGDAFIPGLFYDASAAVFGSAGIADVQIQNELGVQAVALGNHEFDFGTATLAGLISGDAAGDFAALSGTDLDGMDFAGALFPYLSGNLDFSTDENLAPLAVEGGQAPQAGVVTSSTVIEQDGERFGVIGATTPTLGSISSPGGVGIAPGWAGTEPTEAELDALAATIQAEVDALLDANPTMDKVILLAHMQQIDIEFALAERLSDVDIIVAGGSNTRLFDDNDRARDGDSDQGQYPAFIDNAGGTTTAVVNTDGSYKYVGRLVIEFDAYGNIIPESYDADVSGAYATDDQGVAELDAEGLIDPEIQAIADAIQDQILATEGNVFGISDVFMNGNRSGTGAGDDPDGVRTQETNLGNLTADANLDYANEIQSDTEVWVSIKNGGGIRASIGQTVVPAGGSEPVRGVNEQILDGDGNVVKPTGGISQNDIQTTLAFNNDLVVGQLSATELVAVLEHGVAALPGVAGQFIQVAGVEFSFDPDAPAGARIDDAAFVDPDTGEIRAVLVDDGVIVNPDQEYGVVTLGFLAAPRFDDDGSFIGGGDGYPFPEDFDFTALEVEGVQTGDATFADDGTEQDALAEYLLDNHNTAATAFAQADTGPDMDTRIQNLAFQDGAALDAAVDDFLFV